MQLIDFALLGLAAAVPVAQQGADACPGPAGIQPIRDGDKFGLIVANTGGPLHFTSIKASNSTLYVGGPAQNASCDRPNEFATFFLQDGNAFLYGGGEVPQQLWVDPSGMGNGVQGFSTGVEPIPRYAQRGTFTIDDKDQFTFNGVRATVCPLTRYALSTQEANAGYSIWFTQLEKPANLEGCFSVGLRAIKAIDASSCVYTQRQPSS